MAVGGWPSYVPVLRCAPRRTSYGGLPSSALYAYSGMCMWSRRLLTCMDGGKVKVNFASGGPAHRKIGPFRERAAPSPSRTIFAPLRRRGKTVPGPLRGSRESHTHLTVHRILGRERLSAHAGRPERYQSKSIRLPLQSARSAAFQPACCPLQGGFHWFEPSRTGLRHRADDRYRRQSLPPVSRTRSSATWRAH